jgi:hypothetical protein
VWARRGEYSGAVLLLVCHDGVVIECDVEQEEDVKVWLEKAMIQGMETDLNSTDETDAPVEGETRMARSWGERESPMFIRGDFRRSGRGD